MPETSQAPTPEFRDWSIPAVRLLQSVVYSDDTIAWDALLRSRSSLEGYFARLGLLLVVDEPEGYAYLRQWSDEECPAGYENLPKLTRRIPLGYGPTLLCVLVRDELRRFEEEDLHNERCVVETTTLFDLWKAFFPPGDEVRQHRDLDSALHKIEELGFIRKFTEDPEAWEIRRILKARLSAADLETLKGQFLAAAKPNPTTSQGTTNG